MSLGLSRFEPGEQVLHQEIWRGAVWAARPMTVVRDDAELVALWFPEGTRWKAPVPTPTHPSTDSRGERITTCLARGEWVFIDREWDVTTLLLMCPRRLARALVLVARRQGPPLVREPAGALQAHKSRLRDDGPRARHGHPPRRQLVLEGRGRAGDPRRARRVRRELAARVREEGLRMLRRADANELPFSASWPEWRADPAWRMPELPDGWDERCR